MHGPANVAGAAVQERLDQPLREFEKQRSSADLELRTQITSLVEENTEGR